MLRELGHSVTGFSIGFKENGFFDREFIENSVDFSFIGDVRDRKSLEKSLESRHPDVVIHLAAQSLVIKGFESPHETFSTNALGTNTLLDVLSKSSQNINCLIVTTDKVYKPVNDQVYFTEDDALGGTDPYSHSKVVADSIAQFWMQLDSNLSIGIARAGNVIGGGDSGEHRIIPYLAECLVAGQIPKIRYPNAVRPWQHVLDCVSGYIKLSTKLHHNQYQAAWNFGPDHGDIHTVSEVVKVFSTMWGTPIEWNYDEDVKYKETSMLLLDSAKSRAALKWRDIHSFEETMRSTVNWYKEVYCLDENAGAKTIEQVRSFVSKSKFKEN